MPALENDQQRLFIGIPVSESARVALSRQIPSFLPGKPSPLENWHFTLRFIGNADPVQREKLIDNLRATSFGPAFEIEFETLGAFPNPRRSRVVWIGVGRGREFLEKIAEKAESAVVEAGFPAEPRKFSAHLTLSRLKHPESIAEFLLKAQKMHAAMQVKEVILYRSQMGSGHSRYTVIARVPLEPEKRGARQ
ncbi:MAG TPA: RNA 2',3'-cyclic phosphodiesterase [Gemmatimonadaceae bacterium]|nr:RNA 2',3'-cyclic phosphodiesterase [Gemmatimonadaceae bacterium]